MTQKFIRYPGFQKAVLATSLDGCLEDLDRLGFFVIPDVLSQAECGEFAERMDRVWDKQVHEFGVQRLRTMNEYGVIRCMMDQDARFLDLVRHPVLWEVVAAAVGETAILHLQNGVFLEPGDEHHQSAHHRDFAKDFIADRILSLNVTLAVDDFNDRTGGTWVVPGTHKSAVVPSDAFLATNEVQIHAKRGSALVFDSLLIHRAGYNQSQARRRGINHQYTRPFIKQQVDYPALLRSRVDPESALAQTLGFWSVPPKSLLEFRCEPAKRTYRAGQG
jgi:ectoine hydroxylase-related dioxygenase (phytanoyl-CoA dioxygenase family)